MSQIKWGTNLIAFVCMFSAVRRPFLWGFHVLQGCASIIECRINIDRSRSNLRLPSIMSKVSGTSSRPSEPVSRIHSICGNSYAQHHSYSDRTTCSVMCGFLDAHVWDSKSSEPSLSPQIISVFLDKVDRVICHTIVSSILVPSLVLSNEKWKVVSSHS